MSKPPRNIYARVLDVVLAAICVLSAAVLACAMAWPETVGNLNVVAGISFTISVALLIYLRLNPDTVRARQSDTILKIASQTLACFQEGFDIPTAQKVCHLLLPAIGAQAVAITDRESILGYAGDDEEISPGGAPIRTRLRMPRLKTASCVCWARRKRLDSPIASKACEPALSCRLREATPLLAR